MIKAFGIKIAAKEEEIIKKMAAVVNDNPVEVVDLLSYTPTTKNTDILFLYGRKAQNYFKDSVNKYKIEFPDISVLIGNINKEAKQIAYQQLLKLKEQLSKQAIEEPPTENKKLTAESLPDITEKDILLLQEEIITNKKEYWQGINKKGNSIRITVKPEKSDTDINITFAELYTLKIAMETLQLKEIEIVPYVSNK